MTRGAVGVLQPQITTESRRLSQCNPVGPPGWVAECFTSAAMPVPFQLLTVQGYWQGSDCVSPRGAALTHHPFVSVTRFCTSGKIQTHFKSGSSFFSVSLSETNAGHPVFHPWPATPPTATAEGAHVTCQPCLSAGHKEGTELAAAFQTHLKFEISQF